MTTSPEIKYTDSPVQRLFRVSISEPSHRHDQHYGPAISPTTTHHSEPRRASTGTTSTALPNVGSKWGRSPELASASAKSARHTEAEVAKMRAASTTSTKDANPSLKWQKELDKKAREVKEVEKGKRGFWGRVMGTGVGGGN
jgi:hypothetical protein